MLREHTLRQQVMSPETPNCVSPLLYRSRLRFHSLAMQNAAMPPSLQSIIASHDCSGTSYSGIADSIFTPLTVSILHTVSTLCAPLPLFPLLLFPLPLSIKARISRRLSYKRSCQAKKAECQYYMWQKRGLRRQSV
jgi:hypothetical protein